MEQKNHAKFSAAEKGLADVLKAQYEGKLFNKNWGWAIAGVVLLIAAVWLAAAAVVASYGLSDPMMVGTSIGLFALAAVLFLLLQQFRTAGKCLLTIAACLAGAGALALGAPMVPLALESGWWLPVALPLLSLPLVVSAFAWIDAPTKEGRAVLDRIAGFKQYLSITERERLDRMGYNIRRTRLWVVALSALGVGGCVAICGAIGFVGLVAPIFARRLTRGHPGRAIIPSAFIGGALLLAADLAVRSAPLGRTLPIGVVTAMLGAPFFLYLVIRMRRAVTS